LPDLQQRRIGNLSLEVDNDLVGFGAAAWSRDGRLLYYGSHSDIFAANADGSNPRKLLTTTGQPFWLRASPDGRILRFSVANVSSGAQTLWEARSNGSGPRQLFPALDNGANVCCGNWTADGKYFIFETTHGSVSTLWARRDAGTFGAKSAASPRSSPTVT
jgi:Tol biopolymer transport system component